MTAVELRCPACNRFLAEVIGYGRTVCPNCGGEVSYTSKEVRAERKAAK